MNIGDEMLMTDLRRGQQVAVVVLHIRDDGKVLVETLVGPVRRWVVSPSFLSPRHSGRLASPTE